jgi:hypothetical protein
MLLTGLVVGQVEDASCSVLVARPLVSAGRLRSHVAPLGAGEDAVPCIA